MLTLKALQFPLMHWIALSPAKSSFVVFASPRLKTEKLRPDPLSWFVSVPLLKDALAWFK